MSDLPSLRAELEAEGLWANKGLGQHFLLDLNLTRKIAGIAQGLEGQWVIEVGPGPGGLTRGLLEAGAHVIAIEMDARFLPILQRLSDAHDGRLHLIEGDALVADEAALLSQFGVTGPVSIISNLPYNVGTPLLVKWLKAPHLWRQMVLMFQKEVADRIVASTNDDSFGRLAVLSQALSTPRLEMILPARAFTPPPKIDSAVVRFSAPTQTLSPPHTTALERVTAAAFGQRRKMLRQSLKALNLGPEGLADLFLRHGLAGTERAEELSVAQFLRLATEG